MTQFDHQWQKLTAAARLAREGREPVISLGFATRVAARAAAAPAGTPWAYFERFAFRGLMVAAAFGVAAIAFNYSAGLPEQTDAFATVDSIDEMLDLS